MELEEDLNLVADESEGRSEAGANDGDIDEDESDEEEYFDITLAASHSYMGEALSDVSGRVVLEPGWRGCVPVLAHHGVVFPGETVPMLLSNEHDATVIGRTITKDKLFGLLCPDETGLAISGYGVLCEVYEAALGELTPPAAVTFKARAVHRFRFADMPKHAPPASAFDRARHCEVVVLPEVLLTHPLQHARPACLDARRGPRTRTQTREVRRLDAAVSPWPEFVFEIFDYTRMRNIMRDYFHTVGLGDMLPEEPVSLSFWVASNLTVAQRDRLALFVVDNVLLRLHMECRLITRYVKSSARLQKSVLCCTTCGTDIAARAHVFAMSSAGVHANYSNPGGVVHDVATVTAARHTRLSGAPQPHYSWFPGYAWTVALCACCSSHVGWRFDALRRNLRPQQFYGLCRNYVQPRDAPRSPPASPPSPPFSSSPPSSPSPPLPEL